MTDYAWCNLCKPPTRHPMEELFVHLRVEHDWDEQPATWPDGEIVIHDTTLEPADFASPPTEGPQDA